ncbi:LysR family transcriptional regulator [Rhizohabitans arisaemae]|uniref:LysR family transcriptional regulator n=1 Tax=Rhizohabitans arisaemae TaxID=2720610 RepID=UPI0024B1A3EC|nr:LysR family transcriptional regulator [Rhizohabitans arisaemae]
MELRDIELFLTLAEELHFGRTAERLHVTQARVSQAIKKQERRIGSALFERSNRKVALTPVGARLAEDLRPHYQGIQESLERAALAARGKTDVLRVGLIPLDIQAMTAHFAAFKARHPECELRFRYIDFGDPFASLRAGDIDVGIMWLPVREPDLTVGPVIQIERIVLAVATVNPLAARESVSYEDLGDQVVFGGASPDYWREALVPSHTPGGRPIRIGPIVTTSGEMLPIIASGEAVTPLHEQAATYWPRPDVAYVPIRDAPPARWALIWRTATETPLIRAFAQAVKDIGPVGP